MTAQVLVSPESIIQSYKESDENFNICLQFVLSNFKYHRFLSVDSHKIKRAVDGIHHKLAVHSLDEKAAAFKRLTDNFLDSAVFESKETGHTDTHYAILSLLLILADTPTQSDYHESSVSVPTVREDTFDWGSYLLEGEDVQCQHLAEDSDWADEDTDDEDLQAVTEKKTTFALSPTDDVVQVTMMGDYDVTHVERDERSLHEECQQWLSEHLVIQYWKGQSDNSHLSTHSSSILSLDWEGYLSETNPLHTASQTFRISEHQVLREVLWMLSGIRQLVIFNWTQTGFVPSPHINISHLTPLTLHSFLEDLAYYGTIVIKLHNFIDLVANGDTCVGCNQSGSESALGVCQTYQAFCAALVDYLSRFKTGMVELEKDICKQEEPATLSTFLEKLHPRFIELDTLGEVLEKGVLAVSSSVSNSQRASHLLGVMYDILMECDSLGQKQLTEVSLLLPLWIKTCKPYLDIVDEWIANGNLIDPQKEFIIQRNLNVPALDETFWDTAFTLYCTPPGDQSRGPAATGRGDQSGGRGWAPGFILPVLEQIILAGKSMEMLQNLGRLADVAEDKANMYQRRKTLYDLFIESLHVYFVSSSDKITEQSLSTTVDRQTASIFTDNIAQQMMVKGVQDPLLRLNFANLFNPVTFQSVSLTTRQDEVNRKLESLDLSRLAPLQLFLNNCLYPHISSKYERVCQNLLQILKEDYRLLDCMASVRKFFLLEAGDTMYDFYLELFERLRLHETWQDVSFLNIVLQEALQTHFPQDVDKLFVTVEGVPERSRDRKPITALAGLTLHYKVSWPIDVVVNSRCMKVYNQVFSFLVQIKRVKYSLDQLRFSDLDRKPMLPEEEDAMGYPEFTAMIESDTKARSALTHRMHIFRMRLMHFVNGLHDYTMTRILHSTGLEFKRDLQEARDLDHVISIHNNYVSRIHERCLLHKRVSYVKDAATHLLNLALTFQAKWLDGVDSISPKELDDMESEFSKFIQFLSSVLNAVIKRGSFPHLESLAFSLAASNESIKV